MTFNSTLFKQILVLLESAQKFTNNKISDLADYNIYGTLKLDELATQFSDRFATEEIKYCIALLNKLGYIHIEPDETVSLTTNGHKFILSAFHQIECRY